MVSIEINGEKLEAREGAMVIEAADEAGIYIPRFCYHKKLSIAANCRMCLIEVEKVGKALPACATPITDGMKILTRSPKAIAAQKGVMEFLLINHPLDCPICDQGGECELQDIAMGYGSDESEYREAKRVVENKNFGPLIAGEMTRCIHCTRCVRFGEEIAGIKELGATGRGEHMEIGTYIEIALNSELSGNVIDLCPVGALTSKPFRFKARAWEIVQSESIAPHDCLGSNLYVHRFRHEVVRVVPRENEDINETWLSDRDRFSYEGLNSDERLTEPMIKVDDQWQVVDWEVALNRVVEGFRQIIDQQSAEQLGAIASPTATLEELYLLQKLMRKLGSGSVDHRLDQTDFSDQDDAPIFPWLGQSIVELEANDAVLLVGSNVCRDQPIAGLRLRKAALRGSRILCVNSIDYDFHFPIQAKRITSPAKIRVELAGIVKALAQQTAAELPVDLEVLLASINVEDVHLEMAQQLLEANTATILLGHEAIAHAQFADLRALTGYIAKLAGCRLGYLSDGGNGAGAWLAGAVPHRGPVGGEKNLTCGKALSGKDLGAMLNDGMRGFLLLGIEPERDCIESKQALEAMKQAAFVVSLNAFCNEAAREYVDVLLPISSFTETSGTFVNAEGRWQGFEGVVEPRGEARPAWKVLRVLGNLFDCTGFDYLHSQEIRDELRTLTGNIVPDNTVPWRCPVALSADFQGIETIVDRPLYAGDCLVRRADSLQAVEQAYHAAIRVNHTLALQVGLTDGEQALVRRDDREVSLPVVIDERVPNNGALLPTGFFSDTATGAKSTAVTLSRA
jgi:NADH-quinone oxidoreductase subunit G